MCRLRTSASCGGDIPRPHEHETEPHISQVTTDDLLVDAVLPADYDELWRSLVVGEELDEEQQDRLDELEAWIGASDETI